MHTATRIHVDGDNNILLVLTSFFVWINLIEPRDLGLFVPELRFVPPVVSHVHVSKNNNTPHLSTSLFSWRPALSDRLVGNTLFLLLELEYGNKEGKVTSCALRQRFTIDNNILFVLVFLCLPSPESRSI